MAVGTPKAPVNVGGFQHPVSVAPGDRTASPLSNTTAFQHPGSAAPKDTRTWGERLAALGQWGAEHASGVPASQAGINPSYINAFQGALGQVRGHINNQLATALADIGANEAAANSQFAQLPGQINQAYGQSKGTVSGALKQMQAAQQKSGMTPLMNVGAFTAPEMAAVNQSQNYQLQDVPMLQQGAQMEFGRQRAGANMQAQQAQSDLALEQARMQQAAAIAQANQNHDVELERMRESAATAQDQRTALYNAANYQQSRRDTLSDNAKAAAANQARDRMAAAGQQPADMSSSSFYDWLKRAGDPRATSVEKQWEPVFNPRGGVGLTGKALTDYFNRIQDSITDPLSRAYIQARLGGNFAKK